MRVVVTGGAGFIGSHTVRLLIGLGHHVTVFDNFSAGSLSNLRGISENRMTVLQGDIRSYADIIGALHGADACIHLAAQVSVQGSMRDPLLSCEVNTIGFLNILKAVNSEMVEKLVYASSSAVYGDGPFPVCLESANLSPSSPYGLEKLSNEFYAAIYKEVYDLGAIGLRYFNVYGEGQNSESQYSGVMTKFVSDILSGRNTLTIYGTGEQTRDFIHVSDVARANCLALCSDYNGVINVGTGKKTSILKLADIVGRIMGVDVSLEFKERRNGDITHSLSSTSRANESIGFKYEVDVVTGITRYAQWRTSSTHPNDFA